AFQRLQSIKRQASLPSSYQYPILTYFKIGFWDGLSPNSRRGAFFIGQVLEFKIKMKKMK
ncbi:MAG: hypothetical protein NW218_01400, partial [Saprospiraceae bacterium]|nr:hypothetical protein [Saprospiraceae bacterium]